MDDSKRRQYEIELKSYPDLPLGVVRNNGAWPAPRYRYSLAACARWESRYVVEWILYHRSIGIDHIYLYCNDDDPAQLYQKVLPFIEGKDPFVTFLHYSFQGLQFQMYFHFIRNYSHETDWMMFLDIDEFICIRKSNSIVSLMEAIPSGADAIYFNWSGFGCNGHDIRPDGYVLLNYTRREGRVTPFTKVFIKSSRVPYAGFFRKKTAPVMHDYTKLDPDIVAYNVIGDRLTTYYTDFPTNAWEYLLADNHSERILATAFIAHYNIKSNQDFQLRVDRGLRGDYAAEQMWGNKSLHDRKMFNIMTNEVQDLHLHDYWRDYLSCGWKNAVFPKSRWPLISQGKSAVQSSTAHNRSIAADAVTIISGRLLGASQNHTNLEDSPWWQIDLGELHMIHETRVFNRMDGVLDRMSRFDLLASENETDWQTVLVRDEPGLFGGVDGTPFVRVSEEGFAARWLRLVVPGEKRFLHLDQIEFYGVRC